MKTLNFIFLCLAAIIALSESSVVYSEDAVVASAFGYNSLDATDCLQGAIDSGAKKVIVDKQEGPWIVRPISLRSDLELVLEEGVEILAKQGEFKSLGAVLFSAENVNNLIIRGEGRGATLRMRKKDYWNEPYKKSEWRHCVALTSSAKITLENLTIAESGGDGVYIGVKIPGIPCRDITIRNVDCVANNRQGISVISVDGLLIENCVLRDTVGTAPQSGIDFEPNKEDEQISNVVMRNVKCIDNMGDGFAFYLVNMKNTGKDLSIKIVDCESIRNFQTGISFQTANGSDCVLPGKVEFVNVALVGNNVGVAVRSKWAEGASLVFKDCKIVTPSADKATKGGKYADYDFNVVTDEIYDGRLTTTIDSGISFIAVGNDADANGGFLLDNFEIVDATTTSPELLFLLRDASSECVGFKNVSGSIRSTKLNDKGAKCSSVVTELTDEVLLKLFPQLGARRVRAFDLEVLNDDDHLELSKELSDAWRAKKKEIPNVDSGIRIRGGGLYYFYAESGENVRWNLTHREIGQYPKGKVDVVVTTPSGEEIEFDALPEDGAKSKDYSFTTREKGWFRLTTSYGSSTVELTSRCDVPILMAARPNLNVFGSSGAYHFYVPKETNDLGVRIVGSPLERVTATIIDPNGNEVVKLADVSTLGTWEVETNDVGVPIAPTPGFWSIKMEKPTIGILEDYVVTLLGVPALLL